MDFVQRAPGRKKTRRDRERGKPQRVSGVETLCKWAMSVGVRRSWVSTDRTSVRARLCKSHAQGTGVASYRKAFRHRHLNGGIGLVPRGPLWGSADETGGGSLHFALRGKMQTGGASFVDFVGIGLGEALTKSQGRISEQVGLAFPARPGWSVSRCPKLICSLMRYMGRALVSSKSLPMYSPRTPMPTSWVPERKKMERMSEVQPCEFPGLLPPNG